MPTPSTAVNASLLAFCRDLRRLREQAGGPSVRGLADRIGLGKSQVNSILNGRIRRTPDWNVVRGLVEAIYAYAQDHGRVHHLAISAGLDEYWRPRYGMVEYVSSEPERPGDGQVAVVPRQLPPAPPHFVGRAAEFATLSRAARGPVLITGMAGVGKTALAVAWAHHVAERFPDGQLFLNLRGFDPCCQPMTPAQAVRALLEALGVPAQRFPRDVEGQVGLYRSLLADRRMLLVLDDAGKADQVRAVLPATPTCRVVVTSRVELSGLVAADGAYPVAVNVLSDLEARQILGQRLGRDRVDAEPEAVRRLLAACGGLPIALTIVAARAATHPDFTLAAVAEETGRTLRGRSAGGGDDPRVDVWAVFSWSYRALSPPAARLLRLLSVSAGPDIGVAAAASLAGVTVPVVAPLLAELAQAHLVTEPAPCRYGFHDLLRVYAIELAGTIEPAPHLDAARRRYLDHYLHTAYHAAVLIGPHRRTIAIEPIRHGVRPEPLADRDAALRWCTRERAVLLAVADAAGTTGHAEHVWQLAWAVADFLELGGQYDDWIALQTQAVAAARQHPDPAIQAQTLFLLGNAYGLAGRRDEARPWYEEALELFRAAGDVTWQARMLNSIGFMLERDGRFDEALTVCKRALRLLRGAGHPAGEARTHNFLGWCYSHLGRYRPAIEHARRALAYYQETSYVDGQAAALDTLAHARHGMRQYGQAIDCYRQALALLRDHGDRYNEAGTLDRLGSTYAATGDSTAAANAWRQALAIYEDLRHPDAAAVRARLEPLDLHQPGPDVAHQSTRRNC